MHLGYGVMCPSVAWLYNCTHCKHVSVLQAAVRKDQRQALALKPRQLNVTRAWRTHVHASLHTFQRGMTRAGFSFVGFGEKWDLAIVPDVANVDLAMKLVVTLRGGILAPPETFSNKQGVHVIYQCAMASKRKIWMSDGFSTAEPAIHGAIRRLCLCDNRTYRWELLHSADEFQHERAAAITRGTASTVLAIVTKVEQLHLKGALAARMHRHIFDLQQFLHFVAAYAIHR